VLVENPAEFDPRKYLGPGRVAIKDMVAHKMRDVLGCSGKR
jgi:fructose-bisphosphate aldolase class II